jgi:hypothetical protein
VIVRQAHHATLKMRWNESVKKSFKHRNSSILMTYSGIIFTSPTVPCVPCSWWNISSHTFYPRVLNVISVGISLIRGLAINAVQFALAIPPIGRNKVFCRRRYFFHLLWRYVRAYIDSRQAKLHFSNSVANNYNSAALFLQELVSGLSVFLLLLVHMYAVVFVITLLLTPSVDVLCSNSICFKRF